MPRGVKPLAESLEVLNGRRLLYIEDNPSNLKMVEEVFGRAENLELHLATNASEGLALAQTRRPHAILLDINLPGMDGFDVLRRLRAMDETRDIPVLAVSASAMANDIRRGQTAGFNDYLTKPIDIAQLIRAIAKAIADQDRRIES